jgi:hypothetical protein
MWTTYILKRANGKFLRWSHWLAKERSFNSKKIQPWQQAQLDQGWFGK